MPTLRYLAELDDAGRSGLLEALEQGAPAALSLSELHERVGLALGSKDRAKDVVGELFGLAALVGTHNYTTAGVSESVASNELLEIPAERRGDFTSFFEKLLSSPAVGTMGKAAELADEWDRVLHTMRIITDLTPVFAEAPLEPVGAVVTHRLRLTFWNDGGVKEVEIALNPAQLRDLGTIVARAEEKEGSIISMLEQIPLASYQTEIDSQGGGK